MSSSPALVPEVTPPTRWWNLKPESGWAAAVGSGLVCGLLMCSFGQVFGAMLFGDHSSLDNHIGVAINSNLLSIFFSGLITVRYSQLHTMISGT